MSKSYTKQSIRNKSKKIKHISLKSLRKKAWRLQSEYIRRTECGICFTCGVHGSWKSMQAGHYIHGNHMDFTRMNIHCQCIRCNKWLHGNLGIYAERMIAEYGEMSIAQLREQDRSTKGKKFNIDELQGLINEYTILLKDLL